MRADSWSVLFNRDSPITVLTSDENKLSWELLALADSCQLCVDDSSNSIQQQQQQRQGQH